MDDARGRVTVHVHQILTMEERKKEGERRLPAGQIPSLYLPDRSRISPGTKKRFKVAM
jgi:hypothetical protein